MVGAGGVLRGRLTMAAEPTAVIGVGQTKYAAARRDVSIAGLLREAAYRALEMAGKTTRACRNRRPT